MKNKILYLLLFTVLLAACGHKLGYRHFAEPILPIGTPERPNEFVIGDDHSITFIKDRLEVSLIPMTVDMLNRQFSEYSYQPKGFYQPSPYEQPTNPYTYGDWKPLWEEEMPERFTIFLVKVKNYSYPKVWLNPYTIEIVAPNGRRYPTFNQSSLNEYFSIYAIGYAGNTFMPYRERRDVLLRTLYPSDEMIFSGQEREGFIVLAPLHYDVEEFEIVIKNMVLRFDYKNQPLETIDISYRFGRDVYLAQKRRTEGE